MIDHGKNEYSFYAHLQPGSVRVHVGDQVKVDDVIGARFIWQFNRAASSLSRMR